MNSKLLLLLAAALTLPLLTACESEEDRKLAEAEACINRATSGDVAAANACMNKVAGMTSEDAYLIRCSAHFIAQNISEGTLSTGFATIKNATSGGVPTTTYAMSFLLFGNIAGHDINTAMSDCNQSGAVSLYKIVQLSSLGNTLSFGGLAPGATPTDLANAISNFNATATPAQLAEAGAKVLEIKETFCDNGGSFSGTDICNKVNQALTNAGSNPQAIGDLIADYLDNVP